MTNLNDKLRARNKGFERWHKRRRHLDREAARLAWDAGFEEAAYGLRAAPLTQAAPRGYVICINGESDYDRLVEVGNFLCDIVKDDEQHPLFSLFDDVMDAIKTWEDVHVDLDDLSVIADRASTCADIASMTQVNDGMTRKEISETVKGVFRGGR